MSMLAEPRRRQKIGPNPRGKFFTEDEDNKGRSLLQKMGWKSGDGLGVQRQGIKDPIKPKIHTDEKGLGFDVKSDPWVSHTDDFNELLRNLQAAHGKVVQEEPKAEPLPSFTPGFGFQSDDSKSSKSSNLETLRFDLESKSKASSSRIHYHKFVKNKDLSKIKDKDWNCIFGKSEESADSNRNESNKEINGQREVVVVSKSWDDLLAQKSYCIDDTISSSIGNVENEHLNRVQRYKAQMMRSFAISTLPEDKPKSHKDEMPVELATAIDDISSKESSKKRKKKEKKHKTEEEEDSTPVAVVLDNNQELSERKRIKKERKRQKLEESIPEVCEMEIEDEAHKKKKRKKEKLKKLEEEEQPIVEIPEQTEIVSPKKKRKKNKPESSECYDQVNPEGPTVEILGDRNQQAGGNPKLNNDSEPMSESAESVEISGSADDDVLSTPTVNFNKRTVSAEEMHAAALVFKGSNILQIPGYRNQSSKLTYD